jgi:hypothetical protein
VPRSPTVTPPRVEQAVSIEVREPQRSASTELRTWTDSVSIAAPWTQPQSVQHSISNDQTSPSVQRSISKAQSSPSVQRSISNDQTTASIQRSISDDIQPQLQLQSSASSDRSPSAHERSEALRQSNNPKVQLTHSIDATAGNLLRAAQAMLKLAEVSVLDLQHHQELVELIQRATALTKRLKDDINALSDLSEAVALWKELGKMIVKLTKSQLGHTGTIDRPPVVEYAQKLGGVIATLIAITKRVRLRLLALDELIQSESAFVTDLETTIRVFYNPLREQGFLTTAQLKEIFGPLEQLIVLHKQLYTALSSNVSTGKVLLEMSDYLKMYNLLCVGDPILVVTRLRASNSRLAKFLDEVEYAEASQNTNLSSFLIKPIQRICKYPLLLREIIAHTLATHPEHRELTAAQLKVESIVKSVNEARLRAENLNKILEIEQSLGRSWVKIAHLSNNSNNSNDSNDSIADAFCSSTNSSKEIESSSRKSN